MAGGRKQINGSERVRAGLENLLLAGDLFPELGGLLAYGLHSTGRIWPAGIGADQGNEGAENEGERRRKAFSEAWFQNWEGESSCEAFTAFVLTFVC